MNLNGAAITGTRGDGEPLPHGRHGIPKAKVVAHQRGRILRAATTELRQRGFTELAVVHITSRARVSRGTFYALFDNKLDCLLAAHLAAIARLERRIRRAYGRADECTEGLGNSIAELLEFAAEAPDQMHLILFFNSAASEPKVARFGLAVRERLITAIEQAGGEFGRPSGHLASQMAIGAVLAVVGSKLQVGEAERLPDCRADLIRLALDPYMNRGAGRGMSVAV